jgi:peptidoglycan hydrolase-like protein with peptidoglycan-binding domain
MKERLALLLLLLALPLFVSAATFTRPLIIGSHGSDVSALQQILNQQGYLPTSPTDYFGSLTAAALKKFQTAHGIEALGGVGPKTRTLLNSLSTAPTDKAALIASLLAQVKALQAQIAALLAAQAASSTPSTSGSGGGGSIAGSPTIIQNYAPPGSSGGGGGGGGSGGNGNNNPPPNTTPPTITVTSPASSLPAGTTQVNLAVTTNEKRHMRPWDQCESELQCANALHHDRRHVARNHAQ